MKSPPSDFSVVVDRFELCDACGGKGCRKCGSHSSEHAAPGVRVVSRRLHFVPCGCTPPCALCGPTVHPRAAVGVRPEVADTRVRSRWVPSVHLHRAGRARCGTHVVDEGGLTDDPKKANCPRCLKFARGDAKR